MLNHASKPNCKLVWMGNDSQLTLITTTHVYSHEELTIHYGTHLTNADMLLRYGFFDDSDHLIRPVNLSITKQNGL
jgi:SET domain